MLADGRRLLIYMDEFWQWINNDCPYHKFPEMEGYPNL
jgi:type IV secretory pathway VirB4 component